MTSPELQARKEIATGKPKEAAIAILAPRILGAVTTNGYILRRRQCPPMLAVEAGPFDIRLAPTRDSLFFRVDWHNRT